jgi:hypothetical protein
MAERPIEPMSGPRIPDKQTLQREVAAWQARVKLGRLYPLIVDDSGG